MKELLQRLTVLSIRFKIRLALKLLDSVIHQRGFLSLEAITSLPYQKKPRLRILYSEFETLLSRMMDEF